MLKHNFFCVARVHPSIFDEIRAIRVDIGNQAQVLLQKMSTDVTNSVQNPATVPAPLTIPEAVAEALRFVELRDEIGTVNSLAERAGISRQYLDRLVKRVKNGESPNDMEDSAAQDAQAPG